MFSNISNVMLLTFSFVSAVYITYDIFYKKKKDNNYRDIHDAIMFSYGVKTLKKSKYSRCMITESMDRLLYYLNSSQHNIDICMYVITSMDLANVLLKLHVKGVNVRVIIDADMAFSNGSCIKKLEKQGIPVRWMKSTSIMHHKFCLIDTLSTDKTKCSPFVINGSLNWTNQGLNGNWEDVLVTSQRHIVNQYVSEFERLWLQFKPIA